MTSGNTVNRGTNKLGFDRDAEWNDIDGCPFSLGTRVRCANGDVYRLGRATSACTKGMLYGIDEAGLVSDGLTTTLTDALPVGAVGIAHRTTTAPTSLNASATYTYFWLQVAGNFDYVLVDQEVADNALAYTTANAGKLDDGDMSGNIIQDLKFCAATSPTNSAFSAFELHIAST